MSPGPHVGAILIAWVMTGLRMPRLPSRSIKSGCCILSSRGRNGCAQTFNAFAVMTWLVGAGSARLAIVIFCFAWPTHDGAGREGTVNEASQGYLSVSTSLCRTSTEFSDDRFTGPPTRGVVDSCQQHSRARRTRRKPGELGRISNILLTAVNSSYEHISQDIKGYS